MQVEGKLQNVAKGSGLGLPLSRKLAQLLGGNVYVQSKLGEGSTFTAVIPINFEGNTEVSYVPEMTSYLDATRLPVLVVEDNREALFIYEKYLKGTRFQVVPAYNTKQAREVLRTFRPHAIVLDVLLQGEHSWDLLKELKHDPALQDIPVYVITVVDNQQKALALGADAFHPKPVDRLWLLERLQAAAGLATHAKVLVVDDDPASRYLVRTLLASSGSEVIEAVGGLEGLRMARQHQPDVVVLDLVMDDLGGFEVLDALAREPETSHINVIIHTSKMLDDSEQARLGRALDVIPKSIMASREAAEMRFLEALKKVGLSYARRSPVQAVAE